MPTCPAYSNKGAASWYDFAVEIMRMSNIECEVNPVETSEYPTPANEYPTPAKKAGRV